MKKIALTGLHITYWVVYLLFTFSTSLLNGILSVGKGNDGTDPSWLYITNAFVCFYTFYFLLVPKFLARKKTTWFVLSAITVSILTAICTMALRLGIADRPAEHIDTQPDSPLGIVITWVFFIIFFGALGLVNGLLATMLRGFIIWYSEIHIKEVLARKQIETELALLKAQLNPHFLFNTLNNIDVLMEHDPVSASNYLKKLSDIMRFILYETRSERISLTHEFEYINKYIELQKIRTKNNDYVRMSITNSADAANGQIAPMVFIPFIENAFKYCNNKKAKNAIVITIDATKDHVDFYCKNAFSKGAQRSITDGGLGLDLVKQRLQLLYGNRHNLTIRELDNWFEVKLKLNL